MKTEQEIKDYLKWLEKAIKDPDNQSDAQLMKLYAKIDFIKWLGVE